MGFGALDAALAGLRVSQQQLSVISNNVSNVGTPGFTRKVLPQSSTSVDGVTVGVRAENIIRNVDVGLTRDLWTQVSEVGRLDVKQTFLSRIEEFHGPPDSELSIAAEMGRLQETFIGLADSPDDSFFLATAVDQAVDTADKLNTLSDLIRDLRSEAQTEIESTVDRINSLLEQIEQLNKDFSNALNTSRSTALIADNRDEAVKELADLIDISFFTRGDGVMVVQTNRGQELVSSFTRPLTFEPDPISQTSYYPVNVAGVFVGDPETEFFAVDLTELDPGGRLGGLLELRDEIFPKQTAQVDEMAHKLALRFDAQGLRLFTDPTGGIPADTPPNPDPLIIPPATVPLDEDVPTQTVEYIGFASRIQVNPAVINDNRLIQQGTAANDKSLPIASNDVIDRILNYTFTAFEFQGAEGTVDIRSSQDLSGSNGTLQEWLGVYSENEIRGSINVTDFVDPDGVGGQTGIDQLIATSSGILTTASQFNLTFSESRIANPPPGPPFPINSFTINVTLADVQAFAAGPPLNGDASAAEAIVGFINDRVTTELGLGNVDTRLLAEDPAAPGTVLSPVATISPNGEIQINSRGFMEVDGTDPAFAGTGFGELGLNLIGLGDMRGNPQAPTDPYFDVRVGNDDFTRVTIEPGENENDLMEKLDLIVPNVPTDLVGVPSLAVDRDSITDVDPLGYGGNLNLRPGDDYINPAFGGSMQIVSGPFVIDATLATINDVANTPVALPIIPVPATPPFDIPFDSGAGPGTLEDGISLVSALFGSYEPASVTDPVARDLEPVANNPWGSIIDARDAPIPPDTTPEPESPFRETLLGPGANIQSEVNGSSTLIDFSQRVVNQQTQELLLINGSFADEDSLRQALETRLVNESGVNLDEELGTLVVVQTAYSSAARVVSIVDELFEDLLRIL